MLLQGLLVLSLSLLGGSRLSTLANGVLTFMLVGIAFIGGWVEQIGSLLQNETAVDIGIVTSLIMPTEILWRKVLALLQPRVTTSPFAAGPFVVLSQPSDLMIWYAVAYTAVLLLLSLLSFPAAIYNCWQVNGRFVPTLWQKYRMFPQNSYVPEYEVARANMTK